MAQMKLRFAGAKLLTLALATSCARTDSLHDAIAIERIQRDLLAEDPLPFELLQASVHTVPQVGLITPSEFALEQGGDRLSLIMSPPAEVSLRLGAKERPAWLRTAAGVDQTVSRALARGQLPALSIRFEIWQNDRSVYDQIVVTDPRLARDVGKPTEHPHAWYPVGGATGLAVEPGDSLRFRTSLLAPLPPGFAAPRAGFADLLLVSSERRPRERASAKRPNIICIVMDTLRADRTSLHGYARQTTPKLERLAARGLTYSSAWSTSSWTWPATASLLTGLEPEAHGVVSPGSCHLVHELTTLAEVLQEQGYTTAAFSGNPLISADRGFDQGFEHFVGSAEFRKSEHFVPDALRWIEEQRANAFFLYLHLVEPHTPYTPPNDLMLEFTGRSTPLEAPEWAEQLASALTTTQAVASNGEVLVDKLLRPEQAQWLNAVYDAEVAAGDRWLGYVLDLLDELELTQNSVVAFVSDHGEEFFDHGWLGHSHTLHPELVHVPLVLAGPAIRPGERCDTPVSTRHLGPTLAQHAGVKLGIGAEALNLSQPRELTSQPIFFDTHKGRWNGRQYVTIFGVLEGGRLLHYAPANQDAKPAPLAVVGPERRLYTQSSSGGSWVESNSVEEPAVQGLRAAIEGRLRTLQTLRPKRRVAAGASTLKLLQEIGYLGDDENDDSEQE